MMTMKEAVLKSLEDIGVPATFNDVYKKILERKYYEFIKGATPANSVSGTLSLFIINGDTRVKRIKQNGGTYLYYLTQNEDKINFESLANRTEVSNELQKESQVKYEERDLHKLLSTFLSSKGMPAKTIFHEQSNRSDEYQKWVHPDMVAIKFQKMQTATCHSLLKDINRGESFKLSSYELKRELNSDYELKKSFFQAVSNSSWAHFGYLVAFEISDTLKEEMGRLSQSFGIGIIQLNANPFQSKILYQAKYRELDFVTIDKLCKINQDFEKFIELIENITHANNVAELALEKALQEFCDKCFKNEEEAIEYCKGKHIPIELGNTLSN